MRVRLHNSVFNGLGSRKRNGPSGKRPNATKRGFMSDMRLRFNRRFGAFMNAWVDANPRKMKPAQWYPAMEREFYREVHHFETTYYGRKILLTVGHPYIIATDGDTGDVLGVMPVDAQRTIISTYALDNIRD